MSDKKDNDNVIMFPTKAKVPDTITISFGDSLPVTYSLSTSENIDFSGIDTVTVNMNDANMDDSIKISDVITLSASDDAYIDIAQHDDLQFGLDLDDDTE